MTPSDGPLPSASRAQRVSLEAVAREADVSLATASRALSGTSVRPHLRERVERAAELLGYLPDLAAQAVARGTTRTVALIVDYLRSPFGVEITRGVVDAASRHGLVVNVTGTETHPGDLLEMIASARALRPRSLVLATGRVQDPAIRESLVRDLDAYREAGGSVAIVDGIDLPFASCAFDEETAADALATQLVAMGYRRPLIFNSSSERPDLVARTTAIISAFARAGLPRDAISLSEIPTGVSAALPHEELLELGQSDVVLCVEGALLPAVYRHIRSRGLRVGADVGVTAFGQYGIADALRPHLTTVLFPLRRAGELALEHALSDTDGAHLALSCDLRMRASTPWRTEPPRISEAERGSTASPDRRPIGVVLGTLPPEGTGLVVRELMDQARRDGQLCEFVSESALIGDGVEVSALAGYAALLVWGAVPPALIDRIEATGVPCVSVDVPRSVGPAQLSLEVAEGMQSLLEHLHDQGHTRIVYVVGDEADPSERQKRWGIDLFLATHGDVDLVLVDDRAQPSGPDLVDRVREQRVTAVVGHDDLAAARTLVALLDAGMRVPEDVSIAGFGGSPIGEVTAPALTTVSVDLAAVARAAWRLLSADMAAGESHSRGAKLIVRASTGAASSI
ncbi:substrate-binding domain-containing protein [Microbacterium sp. GXF0217]